MFIVEDVVMFKWWCIEFQIKVVDCCLQLYGGYGYMMEYLIVEVFFDVCVQMIYGGMIEIMKEIVGCSLGVQELMWSDQFDIGFGWLFWLLRGFMIFEVGGFGVMRSFLV